ncbi:HAD-IA family hydrolase [Streptomyces lacrimifluminis]|uniref:Haloacid dehalogenase n=1 Tax=Streptomyces lacrimifluminis TaxID=1500077 RepID=A0A917LB54_9ACTN|nr:HAD family phosphatase [Streptomyces lacrimifluminis]GGJ57858.1 haloacid dehalogenase [Streptomyces lacrimifluminis]
MTSTQQAVPRERSVRRVADGGGSAVAVDTIVVDYGGVLTNPLVETFVAFAELAGIDAGDLAQAFMAATERHGETPMAALETGAITERQMVDRILAELPEGAGRILADGRGFGELWFQGRTPNEQFVSFLRALRRDGYRIALLTNNVREWEPLWRAQLPVDELFDVVVDSHKEGVRKPDPAIYRILLDRLGTTPQRCLFVDDTEENCLAAAEFGIGTVRFADTGSAVSEISALLHRPVAVTVGAVGGAL